MTKRRTQRKVKASSAARTCSPAPAPPLAPAPAPAPSLFPAPAFDSWFPPLPRLAEEDRRDILQQRWLSDDVMDLAQEIVRRVRPETRGLYACAGAFTLDPLDPADDTLFL